MRLAVLAPIDRPILATLPGLPRRLFDHVQALQGAGAEVVLFAHPASDPDLPLDPVVAELALDVGRRSEGFVADYVAMEQVLDAVRDGGFDAVHDLSAHPLPLLRAGRLGAPVFCTLPTTVPSWFDAVSQGLRDDAVRFVTASWSQRTRWSDRVESEVVALGVRLAGAPRASRGDHLVWAGRIRPGCGAEQAILAARTTGRSLCLVGPVDDPHHHATVIEPLLGADAVWLGELDAASVREQLGTAAVCVATPTDPSALGRYAREALAEGTPVAAYDQGAMRELVDHHTGALAPVGDVQALARSIERAAACDPHDVLAQARQSVSIDTMAERYLALMRPERVPTLVVARDTVAPLPSPRGPVSRRLFEALRTGEPVAAGFDTGGVLTPTDEDRQLALYVLFELDQGGFADVALDRDLDPGCAALRLRLSASFRAWAWSVGAPAGDALPAVERLVQTSPPGAASALCHAPSLENLSLLLQLASPLRLREGSVHARALAHLHGQDHRVLAEVLAAAEGVGRAHGHGALYAQAMRALGLDATPNRYLDTIPAVWLALPNLLALHARSASTVQQCLGQLALLELDSVRPSMMLAGLADARGFDPAVRRYFYLQGAARREQRELMRHLLAGGPDARARVEGAAMAQAIRDLQAEDLRRRLAPPEPVDHLLPAG